MSKLESHSPVTQRIVELVTLRISTRSLQQGFVLLSATIFGNLIQYLFHFFAGRLLGPTDYGILASLLALSVILTVPTGIVQTVVTQYVAGFHARNEPASISGFVFDVTRALSLACLAIFAVVAISSPLIAGFLNVPSAWPVVAMGTMFIFAGPLTTLLGALQGMQRFNLVGAQLVLGPGFRLLAGVSLIGLGLGAGGALFATTVSNLLFLGLAAPFVRDLFHRSNRHGLSFSQVSNFGGIVLWGTLAFAVLSNIDLVVVKHFFEPSQAGYYSAASVLGKTILAFPGAVAMLMFPKTSFRYALGQSGADLARKSMAVTLGLCGVAAMFLLVFQTQAVSIMFGPEYESSAPLVGIYGATMGLYALVQLLLAFYISQQESRFAWLLVGVTVALTLFLVLFHATLLQVILSLAASAIVILLGSELWLGGLGLVRHPRAVTE